MKNLLTAILAASFLAGCQTGPLANGSAAGAAPSSAGSGLAGTSWMMRLPAGSPCEVPPMIEFGAGQASGDLGCNRFSAQVKVSGDRIEFDQVAVGLKLCGKEFMELERVMKKAINEARGFRRDDSSLIFYDQAGNELLTLVPEVAGGCH